MIEPLISEYVLFSLSRPSVDRVWWCVFHIWKPFFQISCQHFRCILLARTMFAPYERENVTDCLYSVGYHLSVVNCVQGSYLIARSWLRMPRGIDAHGNSLQNTLGCHLSTLFNLSQGIHTWFTVSLWFWEKKMVNLNRQFARVVELMNSNSHRGLYFGCPFFFRKYLNSRERVLCQISTKSHYSGTCISI